MFKGILLQRTKDFHLCERGDGTRSVLQICRRWWVDLSKSECPVAVLLGNNLMIDLTNHLWKNYKLSYLWRFWLSVPGHPEKNINSETELLSLYLHLMKNRLHQKTFNWHKLVPIKVTIIPGDLLSRWYFLFSMNGTLDFLFLKLFCLILWDKNIWR